MKLKKTIGSLILAGFFLSFTNDNPQPPKYKDVEPLLKKYTCIACHQADKKLVGPSYKEIAAKGYEDLELLKLVWKPEPSNWPDYPAMAPLPQVKKDDGLKIAAWINSLK